jgi:hypothetical protein
VFWPSRWRWCRRRPAAEKHQAWPWLFNIGLFSLFTLMYAARWIFFFHGARRIFGHSVSRCSSAVSRWDCHHHERHRDLRLPSETAVHIAEALW